MDGTRSPVGASTSETRDTSKRELDDSPLLTREAKEGLSCEGNRGGCSLAEMEETLSDMELKYAAYVRHDNYGTLGRGKLPFFQKARLLAGMLLFMPTRITLISMILVSYYIVCRICTMFRAPDHDTIEEMEGESSMIQSEVTGEKIYEEEENDSDTLLGSQENYAHLTGFRRSVIVWLGKFLSRTVLFVFGFYWIKVIRRDREQDEKLLKEGMILVKTNLKPSAIISNHVSYIDVLYHMSASFPSFVAKRSVARLPLVGLISKCLGCVYVQREYKPSDFKGVAGIIKKRMQAAVEDRITPLMMLFPEGTTTNGFYLLPFKTGAFLAGTPVRPVILKYSYRGFSPAWDTISGVRHVALLLCQFVNFLEVIWLPLYIPSDEERSNPKLYASNVRAIMALEGGLLQSEIGLKEKRIYHSFLNEYMALKAA
ncbi:hypothetical protein KP509_06G082600 [Ceratopteris richardii]|uniref:Phospholipid/glycerol acyltransferase domain-containing protein n=1 Tax=Ceratopteris richardii TaxID=49495 RepID=A0A8T2UPT9_CERRI|nr:hypothetical protein KP509_06G082600 [Ceratopteris richardii]KAH7435886.1 hypothetical protein KP509_06G082600 [Ceratopteris richardii]